MEIKDMENSLNKTARLLQVALLVAFAPLCGDAEEVCVFSADFETAKEADWHVNTVLWSFRDGVGRRGSRALVYERNGRNADVRVDSPYINIPVRGGERYRIVGYFRGRTDGARWPKIKFSCEDSEGSPVCAATTMVYANNAIDAGNFDKADIGWSRLEILTPFMPRKDVRGNICIMFPGEFQETAMFDDVRVTRVEGSALSALYSSAYRDRESAGPVTFVAECHGSQDVPLRAELSFPGANGAIVRRSVVPDADGEVRVTVDVAEMAKGPNDVVLSVSSPDGKLLGSATNRFFRGRVGERRPRVWSDRFGRTIVNGKPFFPIGLESTIRPDGDILEHYASGPFNCIRTLDVPTLDQLDKYHARGIMWIAGLQNYYYNVRRAVGGARFKSEEEVRGELRRIIRTCKDHPATLAWLTNDEMPVGNVPQAEATYRFFRDLDPDHPVRCCIDQPQNIRCFMGSYDNVCTDPYPIGGWAKPGVRLAGEWTRITRRQSFGIRPMWQVVQAFDWSWYRKNETPEQRAKSGARMPTAEEMRSMSWQCIAEGSNGLLWYAYNCYLKFTKSKEERDRCWLDVCTVASEVRRHADMMLSVEPAPKATCGDKRVLLRVWRYEDRIWLLVCNTEDVPVSAEVSFDGVRFSKGVSALGASPFAVTGGNVSLELVPIGVSLVRLDPER